MIKRDTVIRDIDPAIEHQRDDFFRRRTYDLTAPAFDVLRCRAHHIHRKFANIPIHVAAPVNRDAHGDFFVNDVGEALDPIFIRECLINDDVGRLKPPRGGISPEQGSNVFDG